MSLMYSKKSIGPRTEPCGTPDGTSVMSDRAPFRAVANGPVGPAMAGPIIELVI